MEGVRELFTEKDDLGFDWSLARLFEYLGALDFKLSVIADDWLTILALLVFIFSPCIL